MDGACGRGGGGRADGRSDRAAWTAPGLAQFGSPSPWASRPTGAGAPDGAAGRGAHLELRDRRNYPAGEGIRVSLTFDDRLWVIDSLVVAGTAYSPEGTVNHADGSTTVTWLLAAAVAVGDPDFSGVILYLSRTYIPGEDAEFADFSPWPDPATVAGTTWQLIEPNTDTYASTRTAPSSESLTLRRPR